MEGVFPGHLYFHPYSMFDLMPIGLRLRIPTILRALLPDDIKAAVNDAEDENLDIFFVAQSWPGDSALFRPHYWLDPNAPYQSDTQYNKYFPISYSFITAADTHSIILNEENLKARAQVHNETVKRPPYNIIFNDIRASPSTQPPFLNAINAKAIRETNSAFWSLVKDENTGRYALTLHWLLNEQGQAVMDTVVGDFISSDQKTIATLGTLLNRHQVLQDLYRFGF